MRFLITILIWLFFVPVAEAIPAPNWVLGKGHPKYNEQFYIIGVGHSDKSTTSANESARAELIKSIRVKVSSVVQDHISTNENDSVSSASINSETDFLLEGSQVKDGWYDEEKDIYYSLVVIKRKYVADTLKDMIDVLVAKNDLSLRQADTFLNNGDILKSLVYYYEGYIESSKLFPYIQTYKSVILNNNTINEDDYNLIFKERIQTIIDHINIDTVDRKMVNDQVTFKIKVLLRDTPLKEFPVKFYSVYRNYVDRVICRAEGCETNVDALEVIDKKYKLHLKAVIDLELLEKFLTYKMDKVLFKRLELVGSSFKQQLKIHEPTYSIMHSRRAIQKEKKRKEQIFREMDKQVQRSLRGSRFNFNFRFGNGNININKRF